MPNRWINFVKEYASKNNISYSSALKDPRCQSQYKSLAKKGGVLDMNSSPRHPRPPRPPPPSIIPRFLPSNPNPNELTEEETNLLYASYDAITRLLHPNNRNSPNTILDGIQTIFNNIREGIRDIPERQRFFATINSDDRYNDLRELAIDAEIEMRRR